MEDTITYRKARIEALSKENTKLKERIEYLEMRNELLQSQLADYLFI
jgi:cell division protein FtsB